MTLLNLQRIMTKPSIFRYEGHNYLVPFLIISSLFFMLGFCPWHPGGAESAFPGVVPYQQGDVGLNAGCCLWCLLSDGTACRMDYPEVGLLEGCDNRTGFLRYRCPDVHTGKQDQQFLLLRTFFIRDRVWLNLSGNECESLYYGTGTS